MSNPLPNGFSITLTSLRAQNEGAEVALTLKIADEAHSEQKRLIISTEQYCELKPARGIITLEKYEILESAAKVYSAVRRGEGILSYSANSTRMLTQKLSRRGYDRETAEKASEILKAKGLINEQNDMECEVERCLRKLWGTARIRAHLWSKGFDKDALSGLDALLEDIDFAENCAQLIMKKYRDIPTAPAERHRMIAGLARYGYSMGEIKEAILKIK